MVFTLSEYVKKFNSTKLSIATCLNMILLGNYHKGICFYGALKDKLWHKQSENVHGTYPTIIENLQINLFNGREK